jgi:large subunit ribosomal protein L21
MYAVIRDGGRQFRVEEGMVVDVDLKDDKRAGETVEFPDVLMVGGGGGANEARLGTPMVPGAKVVGEVKGAVKGPKVEIFYWRRRKNSHSHRGHRERYTRVAITKIVPGIEG